MGNQTASPFSPADIISVVRSTCRSSQNLGGSPAGREIWESCPQFWSDLHPQLRAGHTRGWSGIGWNSASSSEEGTLRRPLDPRILLLIIWPWPRSKPARGGNEGRSDAQRSESTAQHTCNVPHCAARPRIRSSFAVEGFSSDVSASFVPLARIGDAANHRGGWALGG